MDRHDTPPERRPEPRERAASSSSSSLFEILDAPLPSEVARSRGTTEPPPRQRDDGGPRERSEAPATRRSRKASSNLRDAATPPVAPQPPGEQVDQPTRVQRRAVAGDRKRSKTAVRRVRRSIKHIDPFSVLKVSLCFYTIFLLVWLVMVALFYNFLEGLGLFEQLQSLGRDLVLPALQNEITLGTVERWALVTGIILVIVGSLINAFLAFIYNIISDLIGGIELTFSERES